MKTIFRNTLIVGIVIITIIFLTGALKNDKSVWIEVKTPELPDVIKLKVAYAINPRFQQLSHEQLDTLLAKTVETSLEHLNIHIRFETIEIIPISSLFKKIPTHTSQFYKKQIYDWKNNTGNKPFLIDQFSKTMEMRNEKFPDIVKFAKPYLETNTKNYNYQTLSEDLVDNLLSQLKHWKETNYIDNKPIIDNSQYNEWSIWDALSYSDHGYDLILTNQLIASAEYYGMDVHSSIRGGITVGATGYSNNSTYSAYSYFSTFIFSENMPLLQKLRQSNNFNVEKNIELAGTYLSHEIGHLLLRLGHPFDNKSCIMRPAQLLNFEFWYENLNASDCKIGSEKQMDIGAIKLYYNKALREN